MASLPLHTSSNRVSSASSPSHPIPSVKIIKRSTAQMCLEKILQIISSRLSDSSNDPIDSKNRRSQQSEAAAIGQEAAERCSSDRIEIDLNLRLGPLMEDATAEGRDSSGACSGIGKSDGWNSFPESGEVTTVEKSSQGECFPKLENIEEDDDEEEEADHRGKASRDSEEENQIEEASDSSPVISTKEAVEQEQSEKKNEGYLHLLLEAVRQISGDFEDDDQPLGKKPKPETEPATKPEPKPEPVRCCCGSKKKDCCCWMNDFYGGFEDTAPVVRSKRGRNQVLPSRYRDSVLEPWKRLTRHKS
ncbi:hypothetical protein AAC387_Pa05g2775 [Persea americana]